MIRRPVWLKALACCALMAVLQSSTQAATVTLHVKPSATDTAIVAADEPHLILYDPQARPGRLLLWLPGTGGRPEHGPRQFYATALAQGFRVLGLSYIDTPAVAQGCAEAGLYGDCPGSFRERRVFGDDATAVIADAPQDAIVNRLSKLLAYLGSNDREGVWDRYLEGGSPRWSEIAVAGQSQGGGMAAFIAKRERVARVVIFSGGWDFSAPDRIADWYARPSATPPSAWFGTYHTAEPRAKTIAETYRAMQIPPDHVYALGAPVPADRNAHVEGVADPVYMPQWIMMLGSGTD